MIDQDFKEEMKQHREKSFAVREEIEHNKLSSDQKILSITHNGYQWSSMSMTESEAIKIIAKIKEMFNLQGN